MILTILQAPTTQTAAFASASVDISALSANADFTVELDITKLTANAGQTPRAVFSVEDSVNAFTATIPRAVVTHAGALNADGKQNGAKFTWRKRDLVGLRAGTTSAVLRLNLTELTGTGASISYKADVKIVS
jgi:hypothetical protein